MREESRPRSPGFWKRPWQWPVRWRLTAVSATLTFLILVTFAVVVGRLASDRLRSDFDTELTEGAQGIAVQVSHEGVAGTFENPFPPGLGRITPPSAYVRIYFPGGIRQSNPIPDLGPPPSHVGILRYGDYELATLSVPGLPAVFVQYARSTDSLDATTNRLWLFLLAGVIGGTLLATLAGVAVASRAMRPIASLTATARRIARTRDPSMRIPRTEADDEVAELAETLDQMLRELDAARNETEQMIQAQREFVADASHELRTPLTSILANLELLQTRLDEAALKGEEGEIISSALRSSRRMGRLVSDLLILARADAGRTSPQREVDLATIGEAALAEVRPVADGHRLGLSAAGPVPVLGNPDELHRLTLNLLENALRHTPSGTEIGLAISRRDGNAVLEVTDDGPGVPPGMEEQIFGRFVRGSGPADVSANGGTGLGLAIVEAVAESHGGSVTAGASPAGGARFMVVLPLLGAPATSAPAKPQEPAANL
jgi:signal transduction histidine kinase